MISFVFPAFTFESGTRSGSRLPGFEPVLEELTGRADLHISASPDKATRLSDEPETELQQQLLTYIHSCAAATTLRQAGFYPSVNAGYSMGIYAALADAGSIRFETGLDLIRIAYGSIKACLPPRDFGMATVIGLGQADMERIVLANEGVWIANRNSEVGFVLSGSKGPLSATLEVCRAEGALNTRMLDVTVPYHSGLMEPCAEFFGTRLISIDIEDPVLPLISLIDQSRLESAGQIRTELARNLYYPLDWFRTMEKLLSSGIHLFIECGSPAGLARNSRFIRGEFSFHTLENLPL